MRLSSPVMLLLGGLGALSCLAASQEVGQGVYVLERDLQARTARPTTSRPTGSSSDGNAGGSSNFQYGYYSYISPVLGLHVAFMLLAFTVLLPCGACVAMLGDRRTDKWFPAHMSLQHLGFFSACAGFVLGFVYREVRYDGGHFSAAHHIVGFVAFCLLLLQVLFGHCRPHLNIDRTTPPHRRAWLWLHRFIALSIFCLAFANIYMGPQTFWKTVSKPNPNDDNGIALMTVTYILNSFAIIGLFSVLAYRLCCAPTSYYRRRREGGATGRGAAATTATTTTVRKRERQDTSPRTSVTKEDNNGTGPHNSLSEV